MRTWIEDETELRQVAALMGKEVRTIVPAIGVYFIGERASWNPLQTYADSFELLQQIGGVLTINNYRRECIIYCGGDRHIGKWLGDDKHARRIAISRTIVRAATEYYWRTVG